MAPRRRDNRGGRPRKEHVTAQVAVMSVAGLTQKEIAERLGVSVRTVYNRLSEVKHSDWFLEAKSRLEAIVPLAVDKLFEMIAAGKEKPVLALLQGVGLLQKHTEHRVTTLSDEELNKRLVNHLKLLFKELPNASSEPELSARMPL